MIRIEKISVSELEVFLDSDKYKEFETIPISQNRAVSYIHNPNARPSDIVLYMAFKGGELVAFRTVFADVFYTGKEIVRFAWFSGNWVHPHFRRQKISTLLFNEIYEDWKGMLIFSNYAFASKKLYDKTNKFTVINTLNGYRHYFRFCLADILPPKKPIFNTIKPLLKILDGFGNILLKLKKKQSTTVNYTTKRIDIWTAEYEEFLGDFKNNELFKRRGNEFKWAIKSPWVKTNKKSKIDAKKYEFTTYANIFESSFYAIFSDNKIVAIIQLMIKDKHLKVPYIYVTEGNETLVSSFILSQVKEHEINFATFYHSAVNQLIIDSYIPVKNKIFSQNFLASNNILSKWDLKNKDIQSGDGDSVFC